MRDTSVQPEQGRTLRQAVVGPRWAFLFLRGLRQHVLEAGLVVVYLACVGQEGVTDVSLMCLMCL